MVSVAVFVIFSSCFALSVADLYEGDVCRTAGGASWTCKRIGACKRALAQLSAGGRPQICSFKSMEPVVCCEPDAPPPPPPSQKPTPRPPPPPQKPTPRPPPPTPTTRKPRPKPPPPTARPPLTGKKTLQKCAEHAEHVFIKLPGWWGEDTKHDTCNQKLEPLIVGGMDALPREFPHMAQIGYDDRKKKIVWKCGGSLISKNFVLSAAHCTNVYSKPAKWVRLGDYDKKSERDEALGNAQTQDLAIKERINHPRYREPSVEYDIALYRLASEAHFNEFVRPVCLNTDPNVDRLMWATGWGNTEYGGADSDVLQKVNLTVVSNRACKELYPVNRENLPRGILDSMICAGDTTSHKDTCQGDSGGPLQVTHPTLYCMLTQVGITSFGKYCGAQPGVYTRISHFIPWIENIVWPE